MQRPLLRRIQPKNQLESQVNEFKLQKLAEDIVDFKKETEVKVGNIIEKAESVASGAEEAILEVKSLPSKIKNDFEELTNEIVDALKEIKSEGLKGDKGEDADEEAIEKRLLAKIPEIDIDDIAEKASSLVKPTPASLKIIKESVELKDEEIVPKLNKATNLGDLKLSISNIKDWNNKWEDIKGEISRNKGGYHGGGFNNIANASGTVSTGLDTLKFTGAGVSSVTQTERTVTVDIAGGGGSGTVTNIATAGLISGGPITTTGTITTSMATGKLVGRSTAGTGIMEEITVGSGLTLSGGTLTATGGGTGDVVGPASATDNAVARFDTTTGKLIQNSGVTIDDTNIVSAAGLNLSGLTASQIVATDASKNLQTLTTATYPSLTELSYVKGVTSAIQTQLNAKGSGTVTNVATAGLISGGPITTTGTITTSMATGKLVGRSTAGTGIMEEITVGSGLTLSGGTLTATGGTGDVVGPASSTDNALARFDGTTGKLIQNSSATLSDAGVLTVTDIVTSEVKASGSGGLDILNSSGSQAALFGAGGSTGTSLFGTTNIGSASADYIQITGGTGATTFTATGSSTNVDITAVPKGSGAFKINGAGQISGSFTLSGGTANGVAYLDGSKVVTTGSSLTFNGTNLGVGTASPGAKLTVSDASTGALIRISSDTNGSDRGFQWYNNATSSIFGSIVSNYTNGILTYDSGGSVYAGFQVWSLGTAAEQMRLTSTGLAIGTTSTSARLNVQAGTSATGTSAYFANVDGVYNPYLLVQHSSVGIKLFNSSSFGGASNNLIFGNGSTSETMRIDASGNLLIGTTSTSGLWSGSERLIALKSTSSDAAGVQVSSSNAQNTTIELFSSYSSSVVGLVAKGGSAHQSMIFSSYNGASYAERARIDTSGNFLVEGASGDTVSTSTYGLQFTNVNQLAYSQINTVLEGSGGINGYGGVLRFYTKGDNSASLTERMRIDYSGNATITTSLNVPQVFNAMATATVTANAATITRANRNNKFVNSSAAAMTITLSTASAAAGDMLLVQIYDFSAATQTITWVNTENSTVTVPATSNGSTTLPLTVGFMWNASTSKWRCIASA